MNIVDRRQLAFLLIVGACATLLAACEPEPTDTPATGAIAPGTERDVELDVREGGPDAGAVSPPDEGDGTGAGDGGDEDAARESSSPLTPLTLMLDWVPNTNHAGLYLALAEGAFESEGLEVEIIQPGEVFAEHAVASGIADVGVSFQEALTLARAGGAPLVSIGAIIQHNTSAFAAPESLGVESPADFAGLRYGSFGSPFELPTLHGLMRCAAAAAGTQADLDALEIVDIGFSDPLPLLETGRIDLVWIFEAWQGLQARREGLALDLVRLSDHTDCIPDYYTPILVTSEATIAERPDVLKAFMTAVSSGYTGAIERPDAAAAALLAAAPELDPDLVDESMRYLAPRYADDAPRWGEQRLSVWTDYALWLEANGVIEAGFEPAAAFTNAFLPTR